MPPASFPPSSLPGGAPFRPNGEVRVKGVSIRSFLAVLEAEHGAEVIQGLEGLLETEFARAIRYGNLSPGAWYPIAWYRSLHRTTHKLLGVGPSFSRKMGYLATKVELSGIYKVFAKLVSPEMTLQLGAKLFRTYYDRGRFTIPKWSAGQASGHWDECRGFDEAIWEDVVGGIIAFLEAAGAKKVHARIVGGGHDGDATMDLEADWV